MNDGVEGAAEPGAYKATAPKPFVFVLMPFEKKFGDIYKFGIKGAAEEAGAYAERVDEQMFDEGILERVFNQINKADVLVADMTGRNPNVFYEVGYAHALGKIVLLLTQTADDIPFDLKGRPHIVYHGVIEALRSQLSKRLPWALKEAAARGRDIPGDRFSISLEGTPIPEGGSLAGAPAVRCVAGGDPFKIAFCVRNESSDESRMAQYVYLFADHEAMVAPCRWVTERTVHLGFGSLPTRSVNTRSPRAQKPIAMPVEQPSDGLVIQYRLPFRVPNLAPWAVEEFPVEFLARSQNRPLEASFKLRLHTYSGFHDYPFRMVLLAESQEASPMT